MSGLLGWGIESLIASALSMAAILALRAPVRRIAGPRIAYALWALPALRLVLPPMPHWPGATTPVTRAGETIVVLVAADAAATPAAAPAGLPIAAVLVGLWGAGAVLFLCRHVVRHRQFRRQVLEGAMVTDTIRGIRIVESAHAPGPLAFGIVDRFVAFPVGMADRYDADERALALAHELGHHARGDLIANWVALLVLAVHWFDPVAWRAFHAFRADQERANDAGVLAGRSAADRHVYASAIVKSAQGGAVSAACHLHSIADLKGRLKMLTTTPSSRRRLAFGATTVGAIVVAGLGLTASGSGAAAIGAGVQDAVAAPIAPPVPPATPAVAMAGRQAAAVPAQPAALPANAVRNVVVTKDGRTTVHNDYTSADIDAHIAAGDRIAIKPAVPGGTRMIVKMPDDPTTLVEVQDIPAIRSATCGIGTGTPASMVIENGKGPGRRIVICTDRIRKVTADAMVTVGNSKDMERNAYAQALSGLLDARTKVVADVGMTPSGRAEALAAIDQSIAEMRSQLARAN